MAVIARLVGTLGLRELTEADLNRRGAMGAEICCLAVFSAAIASLRFILRVLLVAALRSVLIGSELAPEP